MNLFFLCSYVWLCGGPTAGVFSIVFDSPWRGRHPARKPSFFFVSPGRRLASIASRRTRQQLTRSKDGSEWAPPNVSPLARTSGGPHATSIAIKNKDDDDGDEGLELNYENVNLVLDTVRPMLVSDGGDLELMKVTEQSVSIRFKGNCGSCATQGQTIAEIERLLRSRFPALEKVHLLKDGGSATKQGVMSVMKELDTFLRLTEGRVMCSFPGVSNEAEEVRDVELTLVGEYSETQQEAMLDEIKDRLIRRFPDLHGHVKTKFVREDRYFDDGDDGDDEDDRPQFDPNSFFKERPSE
eukprot:Selendium_serpulae@DN2871_c0_g1_i1.p1